MLIDKLAVSGMTLETLPACAVPMVTTEVCKGSILRDTTVCKLMIKLPMMTTGSTV